MASFTEQAILKVVDQSSAQLRKINAELKKLFATAKSLKSIKIDLNINTSKLAAANKQINTLASNLNNLGRHSRSINVDTSKLAAANKHVNTLASNLNNLGRRGRAINVDTSRLSTANRQVNTLASSLGRLHSQNININANAHGITQAHNRLRAFRSDAARPVSIRTLMGYGATGTAVRGLGRASVEGGKQVDTASVNLDMLQLDERRRKLADAAIDAAEKELASYPGAQQFNRALISGRYAENLRQVREGEAARNLRIPLDKNKPWGATRAATADEMQAEFARRMEYARQRTVEELHVADMIAKDTGTDPVEAIKKVQGYFKALDQAGHLTDDFGNFDPKKMKEAGEFVRSMRMAVGEEYTGQFLATLVRREKGAKYGLNFVGQAIAGYIAEDQGPSTAGTALSSWMQQAHIRSITKEAIKNQLKAGLIKDPVYAKDKKGRRTDKLLSATVVDSEKSMAEPLKYARENLVPALKTMGLTDDEIFSNAPANIDKVTTAINKLYSNTNSANFALTLMTKLLELEKQEADRLSRDPSAAAVRASNQNSVSAAVYAVKGQFKEMMGQVILAAEPAISGVSKGLSDFFKSNAQDIREVSTGGPDAAGALVRLGSEAAGAALVGGAAYAGYRALRWGMEKTGAAEAVGWGSGMMALTTGDDATRALGGAGISLIEAASALKSAAAALANDPSLGPVSMDPNDPRNKGKPPKGPTKPGTGSRPGAFSRLGTWISGAGKTIATVATTAAITVLSSVKKISPVKLLKGSGWLTAAALTYEFIDSLPDDAKTRRTRLENNEKLNQARRNLANESQILDSLEKAPRRNEKLIAAQQETIARLRREIGERERTQEALRWGVHKDDIKKVKTSKVTGFTDQPIPGNAPILQSGAFTKAVTDGVTAKPITTVPVTGFTNTPIPGTTPILPGGFTPAGGTTPTPSEITPVTTLNTLIPQLASSANSITLAATDLASTSTTFSTVFSTGATAIGSAGQTAADTLSGAAPSIGAAIGNAAAAAISAAAAQVSIQVNHTGDTKPNTGASAP